MIHDLWPTPFQQTKMDDSICERMAQILLQEYDLFNAPSDFGLINVLDNPNEVIAEFKETVVYPAFNSFLRNTLNRSIDDWGGHRTRGWIAGYNSDYSLTHHNHQGSQISSVFYLMCNVQDKGGEIVFTDPRQNSNRGYDMFFQKWFKPLEIKPQTGDIVVFPSYLYHYVQTYKSNIRLALPVDLFLFNSQ